MVTEVERDISVLLVYPDSLESALGSPGFREVLRSAGKAENALVDWAWFEKDKNILCFDNKGNKNRKYDIVGLSIPYELLYENVVKCLVLLGIEPLRETRNGSPLVMLGGAAVMLNPVLAGEFADIVCTGEAEASLPGILETAHKMILQGAACQLTPMVGIYIPILKMVAPFSFADSDNIDSSFFDKYENFSGSVFRDAALVEVGRGCSRGCRFCAAGQIYLPCRPRKFEHICADIDTYIGKASRIGFVGASVSDFRYLGESLKYALDKGFEITTSSFRADMLKKETANILKAGGIKTMTIAPEAGSERMRKIINKNLSESQIIDAAISCKDAGIKNLKLYFIIGLPFETENDISAIAELTIGIKKAFDGRISVSINPFIPKPRTPFQWCRLVPKDYYEKNIAYFQKVFRRAGISFSFMSHREAEKETVISFGDRKVAEAICMNAVSGIPFKKALRDSGVNILETVYTEKDYEYDFPWDIFFEKQTKKALRVSYMKSQNASLSSNSDS